MLTLSDICMYFLTACEHETAVRGLVLDHYVENKVGKMRNVQISERVKEAQLSY